MPAKAQPIGRHHERKDHRGPGVLRRRDARERKQARADNGADAQRHQVHRA